MLRWSVAVAPTSEPLTLSEARQHLREPEEAENARISANLTAARQHIETVCERAIMPQSWRLSADGFCGAIRLPGGDVRAITSVKYFDKDGAELMPVRSSVGLALTRSLLAVNACSLSVDPVAGTGTLFSLLIPAELVMRAEA